MNSRAAITLITGMAMEKTAARRAFSAVEGTAPQVLVAGPGAPDARRLAEQAKAGGAQGIVSFGVCGGLDPSLQTGTVVLPEEIRFADGSVGIATTAAWRGRLKSILAAQFITTTAPLLSAKDVITSPKEKQQLFSRHQTCAVDMESGPLARAANEADLSFIAVRVIYDDAQTVMPQAFSKVLNPDGSVSVFSLIKALVFNWPGTKTLKTLSAADAVARTNLEDLARLALPDFGFVD